MKLLAVVHIIPSVIIIMSHSIWFPFSHIVTFFTGKTEYQKFYKNISKQNSGEKSSWIQLIPTKIFRLPLMISNIFCQNLPGCKTLHSNPSWALFMTSVLERCGGIYPRKFVAQTLQIFISDVKHTELTSAQIKIQMISRKAYEKNCVRLFILHSLNLN